VRLYEDVNVGITLFLPFLVTLDSVVIEGGALEQSDGGCVASPV
jgi:hypothetical protein